MLKIVLFYGGMLVALLGTIFVWLVWRPKLMARISIDDVRKLLRCSLRVARTFKPIRVTMIKIPTEYMEALGASPPAGFKEDPRRYVPTYRLYDNSRRELVQWKGRLDIRRGESVELLIPCEHPKPISGTLEISYKYLGLGGVAIMATWTEVPLNATVAKEGSAVDPPVLRPS